LVIVVDAKYARPELVKLVEEALPSVEVPAVRVVILAFVAVRLVKKPVTAVKSVAKKLVLVAFVAVSDEMVVVASVEVPTTDNVPVAVIFVEERLEVEALPSTELVAVTEVKIGFGETAIVEVPESVILLPAIK